MSYFEQRVAEFRGTLTPRTVKSFWASTVGDDFVPSNKLIAFDRSVEVLSSMLEQHFTDEWLQDRGLHPSSIICCTTTKRITSVGVVLKDRGIVEFIDHVYMPQVGKWTKKSMTQFVLFSLDMWERAATKN